MKEKNRLFVCIACVAVVLIILGISAFNNNCNANNNIMTSASSTPLGFQDTGMQIKNPQNRVYHIIKNKYGYLYYSSDVAGDLTEVLNKYGKPTTNINDIK